MGFPLPKELMVFADDLAKANESEVDEPHFPVQMKKWSNHLKGLPVFRIEWTEYTKNKIAKFGMVALPLVSIERLSSLDAGKVQLDAGKV